MSNFIRDDAEALMQYGSFECPDFAYEAHRISQHEEDAVMIEIDIENNAMTEDEIAEDAIRRQNEAEKFNEALSYFLEEWMPAQSDADVVKSWQTYIFRYSDGYDEYVYANSDAEAVEIARKTIHINGLTDLQSVMRYAGSNPVRVWWKK